MPDHSLPNRAQTSGLGAGVADRLDKYRLSNALSRKFTIDGQTQRGEAYLEGSRILIEEYCHLMNDGDRQIARDTHGRAVDAREQLDHNADVFITKRFFIAREFKGQSKKAYRTSKRASDRGLDQNILGSFGGTGSSTSAPPTPPEEPRGTNPSAGASPGTPEEPDLSLPPDSFTDSHVAITNSVDESIEDVGNTVSSGVPGIEEPVDTDDVSVYHSIYNTDLATSRTSITSYKTEALSIVSHKSHYNALPRHKYADQGCLRPQDAGLLSDTSVLKTESRDEHLGVDEEFPQNAPPNSPELSPEGLANTEQVHEDTQSQPLCPRRAIAFFGEIPAGLTTGAPQGSGDIEPFGFDTEPRTATD